MAAPADYWDEADLKALAAGGFVNEDVMAKIWDISQIPLPFSEAIGSDTAQQSYTEWVEDALGAVNTANAAVSGADATGNNAAGGSRKGNHCQNSVKVLAVTERTQSTSVIGTGDEYARQIMMRQQELRRDVEAIALTNQASVADDNDTVAGKAGGFSAWLETNTLFGAGGADGGFNTSTKVVDTTTPGDGRALNFDTMLRASIEACYLANANTTLLMSVPQVIKRLNTFMFSATGQGFMSQPVSNVSGENPTDQVSQGFINVMRTDFGFTMRMVPNRLQQVYDSGDVSPVDVADVFLIDPQHVALAYLKSYTTKPLAKLGLSERSQISVDWTVKVYVESAHGVIRDILPTSAVV